jgi:hypothetical protein
MFCPECGNQNPDTAKFCIKCGYQYAQTSNSQIPNNPPPKVEPNSYSSQLPYSSTQHSQTTSRPLSSGKQAALGASAIISLGLIVLIVGGIIAFIVYEQHQRSRNSYSSSSTSSSSLDSFSQSSVPQIRQGSQRLGDQAFTVGPRQTYYVKFTIPENWRNAVVVGSFSASGGDGNDVQVFITDEKGYTNIKNGHAGRVWYDSGKVTTDSINTKLGSGTYYLVFSNSFSLITNKAVNADIQLQYEY